MTIDITIGKIKIRPLEEVLKNKLDDEYRITYKDILRYIDFLKVEQCPDELDGCTKKDTMYPNSAYRSGATLTLYEFFDEVMPELIDKIRKEKSNDIQIAKIKPFLKELNELEYKGKNKCHIKRLHWFKFWSNKAIELYGEEAGIMFS